MDLVVFVPGSEDGDRVRSEDEGLGLAWRSSGEWSGERAEHEAGFFLIRDSVDPVAGRLDVTRYAIHNYLGEIRGRPALRRLHANRDTEPPVRRSRRAAAVNQEPGPAVSITATRSGESPVHRCRDAKVREAAPRALGRSPRHPSTRRGAAGP